MRSPELRSWTNTGDRKGRPYRVKTNHLKLLDLRQTTNCSPTLIRFAALSTFPEGEGMGAVVDTYLPSNWNVRYWMASATWTAWMVSLPARSAMVRATRKIRS